VSAVVAEQQPALLLADEEFLDRDPGLTDRLPVHTTWSDDGDCDLAGLVAEGAATPVPIPDRPGRTVVMTSGTTSTPKGARRPHPHGLSEAASLLSVIPRSEERRVGDGDSAPKHPHIAT